MNVEGLVLNLIWFVFLPLSFGAQLHILNNNYTLKTFFKDWQNFELSSQMTVRSSNFPNALRIRKIYIFVNAIRYIIMLGVVSTSTFDLFISDPIIDLKSGKALKLLMQDYPELYRFIPKSVLGSIHLLSTILMIIFVPIVDLVPAFVYSHSATLISLLCDEIKEMKENAMRLGDPTTSASRLMIDVTEKNRPNEMEKIWSKYEAVRELVKRADSIFGPLIISNHGLTFFMICALVFSLFSNTNLQQQINNFVLLFTFIVRLIMSVQLTIRLPSSGYSLCTALVSLELSTSYWNQMVKRERYMVQAFRSRIEHDRITATPSGLYEIKASLYLTFISLIITYTIVLVQFL